eukprot:scaffold994_cov226-Prasinococcus_capsulatus_cf.AAC.24
MRRRMSIFVRSHLQPQFARHCSTGDCYRAGVRSSSLIRTLQSSGGRYAPSTFQRAAACPIRTTWAIDATR